MIGAAWVLLKRLRERQAAYLALPEWTCCRCGAKFKEGYTGICYAADANCTPVEQAQQATEESGREGEDGHA